MKSKTEIEAIHKNELHENEVEEHCLEIELQFLQGNKNTYGEPYECNEDLFRKECNYEYSNYLKRKKGSNG